MNIEMIVRDEVHYCVSALVADLCNIPREADELAEVMTQLNWINAAFETVANTDSPLLIAQARDFFGEKLDPITLAYMVSEDEGTAREFCELSGIEPKIDEALEHWIVAECLADELEELGEMVLRDWHGLTIWGRTTSDQSIEMDHVMQQVVELIEARGVKT